MHSTGVAIACSLVAAASVIGVSAPSSWTLFGLTASIAVVGVPHGGLDHLTGRKLLANRLPAIWPLVFFPGYLAVALLVVAGWFLLPLATAVIFFVISAWHFGLEDDRSRLQSKIIDSIGAVAIGGLVIWIPMLTQAERVGSILQSIVPSGLTVSVSAIIETGQAIACVLVPFAALVIARDALRGKLSRALRNTSFVVLFAVADVLISFGVYFCGWHSIRGLARLARDHGMNPLQLASATAPLSLVAIGLAGLGMWFWSSGQGVSEATSRTLFVALSAMAVPHLLLHGPITEVLMNSVLGGGESLETVEATT